jgi:ketosteroid isomerase-like protein
MSLSANRECHFRWLWPAAPIPIVSCVTEVKGSLIEGMFAAIDARDWDTLPAFFHSDIVYERPGYDPFVGCDRVMHFYRGERMIQQGVHTLEGTVVENGRAAAWGWIDAVLMDGTPVKHSFADIYLLDQYTIRLRRSHFFVPAV